MHSFFDAHRRDRDRRYYTSLGKTPPGAAATSDSRNDGDGLLFSYVLTRGGDWRFQKIGRTAAAPYTSQTARSHHKPDTTPKKAAPKPRTPKRTQKGAKRPVRRQTVEEKVAQAIGRNAGLVHCMFKGGGSVPGQRWVPSAPATPRTITPVNPIKELRQVQAWAIAGIKADAPGLQGSDMLSWPELKKLFYHCGLRLSPPEFDDFISKLKQHTTAKSAINMKDFLGFIDRINLALEHKKTMNKQPNTSRF